MKVVPITMITGFLGAGKSTLINRILKQKPDTKFGLIVNEFGDVNLESQILETTKEEVVELSNGCMCCVVRKDIVSAVETLLNAKKGVDYIIVEASGLSDPVPIAQTFLMNDLDGRIRLDAVLCLVDSENFEKNMEQFQIAYTQLQAADIVLLSKVDAASPEYLKKVKTFLKQTVPNSPIISLDDKFQVEQILDTSSFDHTEIAELEVYDENNRPHTHAHDGEHHDRAQHTDHNDEHSEEEHVCGEDCKHDHHEHGAGRHDHAGHNDEHCEHGCDHESGKCSCGHDHDESDHHHEHHHAHEHVDTVFFKSDKPLDFKKFSKFITTVPDAVIRAKGFVWFGETAEQDLKYILQFVGARRQLQYKPWADGEKKQTAVVFIGKTLPKKKLSAGISSCVREAE